MAANRKTLEQEWPQIADFVESLQVENIQQSPVCATDSTGNSSTNFVRVHLSDIEKGLLDTSPVPRGNWRSYWVMNLNRQPSSCRLPRGFGKFDV